MRCLSLCDRCLCDAFFGELLLQNLAGFRIDSDRSCLSLSIKFGFCDRASLLNIARAAQMLSRG
jgi:hypothetical protein